MHLQVDQSGPLDLCSNRLIIIYLWRDLKVLDLIQYDDNKGILLKSPITEMKRL